MGTLRWMLECMPLRNMGIEVMMGCGRAGEVVYRLVGLTNDS